MVDSDLSLLDRWRAGDSVAGNLLFKRHFVSLYRFFEYKTEGEVDDLVQETLLQCVKAGSTFRRQSTFRTYLFSIARHVLFQHWRARARVQPTLDFEAISMAALSTSIGSRLARSADRARLLAALQTLPLDQQLLLELYYWEELDRDQLAEVFEVETATIGSRLFRARRALQNSLERPEPGGDPATGTPDAFDAWARKLAGDPAPEK
ncbi:MAG TPA: sigma-70 family RNA polymerase sigma factor [Kofleriaceae bacterium]|jgi:RNA polymerase sigma-70 factor (ECF subfamily)|nr:sigma-70 family RNA polymerase sigma factor [Kofleriaceae bacterium]